MSTDTPTVGFELLCSVRRHVPLLVPPWRWQAASFSVVFVPFRE
jgi:hypothetical protein